MRISELEAIARIKRGEVIALPTETVYGLAASIEHPSAIYALYAIKKRPCNKPFTLHLANPLQVVPLARAFPKGFYTLAKQWPGPLTLILPANLKTVPECVRAGLDTAGFRVPAHPVTQKILEKTGPVAMASANLSGEEPALDAEEIASLFGEDFPIVERGNAPLSGIPSTIREFRDGEWVILR